MASAQAESSRHEVIPPTIRLQLWCYTELGRTSSANRALATFLTAAGVDDWLITATRPSGTPESSKDRFIPIEVSRDPETRRHPPYIAVLICANAMLWGALGRFKVSSCDRD